MYIHGAALLNFSFFCVDLKQIKKRSNGKKRRAILYNITVCRYILDYKNRAWNVDDQKAHIYYAHKNPTICLTKECVSAPPQWQRSVECRRDFSFLVFLLLLLSLLKAFGPLIGRRVLVTMAVGNDYERRGDKREIYCTYYV